MKYKKLIAAGILSVFASSATYAEGELKLFNWGNYTSPELLEKFEKETGIKVTVDGYDSNEAMLAKVKAGGHGYDLAVPSDFMVKIMIDEGLIQPAGVNEMENFKNVKQEHVDVYFDPGRVYGAPWQFGSTGISLNTKHYDGPKSDSWALAFDPPEELKGRINMVSEMNDVIAAGLFYLGFDQCNDNKDELKKLNDMLIEAKKDWRTIDYGVIEKLTSEDVYMSHNWNGASMRARLETPTIKYVYPKEGLAAWADNVVLLSDAQNVEEAKTFLNFIMAPENAALISNFARYGNAIAGSEAFMDEVMGSAPEIIGYEGAGKPQFIPTCPQEVTEFYTKIWNNLLK
jgi:spermidine/putrescine transport system substrate-binding protein